MTKTLATYFLLTNISSLHIYVQEGGSDGNNSPSDSNPRALKRQSIIIESEEDDDNEDGSEAEINVGPKNTSYNIYNNNDNSNTDNFLFRTIKMSGSDNAHTTTAVGDSVKNTAGRKV